MRAKGTLLLLVGLSLATTAWSQTKISGAAHCDKPSDQQSFEVGDRPHHSFMITKGACTWTKPLDLDGVQTKTDAVTQFIEVRGNRGRNQGYVVNALANGDKLFVRIQGQQTTGSVEGKWTYTGGIARSRASTPSARSDGALTRPAPHTNVNPSARIGLRNRGDPPPADDFVAVVKHCRLAGGDGALGFEELDSRLAARAA